MKIIRNNSERYKNKKNIATNISRRFKITKKQALAMVDFMFNDIIFYTKNGFKVRIANFGVFQKNVCKGKSPFYKNGKKAFKINKMTFKQYQNITEQFNEK